MQAAYMWHMKEADILEELVLNLYASFCEKQVLWVYHT